MRPEDQPKIRSEVSSRLFDSVLAQTQRGDQHRLSEVINDNLYHELERLRRGDCDGDPAADKSFYMDLRRKLPHASDAQQQKMLRTLLDRFVDEICGNFDERVYRVSTRFVPLALGGLLTGLSPGRLLEGLDVQGSLDRHVVIDGDVEQVHRLNELGTLVFAPTHVSNLDSVVLGYTFHRMGLPPVIYGAGLNLFTNRLMGYFMRNLGAYTVDRRKTAPLYKNSLKEYATATLEMGYNNLFFPGGTRCRNGAIETQLKKGLLGTSIGAYRNNLTARADTGRIFIVPVNLSFPLVLEAATLIREHLRRSGRARYIIVDDEFSRARRWFDFIRGLVTMDAKIHVTFGDALDPFGNDLNEDGDSLDPTGRVIDPARYLHVDGKPAADTRRDMEYTRMVSSKLMDRYRQNNVALETHALAFTCLELYRRNASEQDLYRFLRSLGPEMSLNMDEVEQTLGELIDQLQALEAAGKIRCTDAIREGDIDTIIRRGLRSFGTYHTTPVLERRGVRIHLGDTNLLFYYRNRLEGYGLLGAPNLLEGDTIS